MLDIFFKTHYNRVCNQGKIMEKIFSLRKKLNKNSEFIFYNGKKAEKDFKEGAKVSKRGMVDYGRLLISEVIDDSIDRVEVVGGYKQITTYKTPVKDIFGIPIGFVAMAQDVTDFKRGGIQISMLIENIPMPFLIINPDSTIMQMNQKFICLMKE